MRSFQKTRVKLKTKWRNKLFEAGWTTDEVWWYHPRSGFRYPFDVAIDLEKLKVARINI